MSPVLISLYTDHDADLARKEGMVYFHYAEYLDGNPSVVWEGAVSEAKLFELLKPSLKREERKLD